MPYGALMPMMTRDSRTRMTLSGFRFAGASIGLIVVSLIVAGYILDNQRLALPGWVPVIGKDFYSIEAELSTAQAVTPGQGQTVNIAGVEVGEIKRVRQQPAT